MDRAVEADGRPPLCELLCSRARSLLAGRAFSRLPAGEIGLHEVARHAIDATVRGCQGCLARTSTDAAELGTGLLNPGDRPKLLEAGERLADRSAGRKLL